MKKALKIIGTILVLILLMGACGASLSDEKADKAEVQTNVKKPKKVISKTKPVKVDSAKENFSNCDELNEVYPDGVDKNHPAYQEKMDRNKDGFACEKK